ncbi:hypothetical protein GGI12_000551 [Dipsacomyces acuminosporus]|nr:hypothetical protein GGI12_000551 [Dipsacomyces acuminosporus]
MVVENAGASNPACDAGPTILFAADSINRILDADSSDLQGLPFLSIVAFEDIPKAAAFLANALHSSEPLFERLSILVNPIEESNSTNPRIAALEFMGIGSDDGAILLCQLLPPSAQERSDNDGYLSLGDIISSDPDTSDYPELWDLMDLE